MNEFKRYHPFVNFMFFLIVIAFSMIFMHPAYLLISLFSAFVWQIIMKGTKAVKFGIFCMLPVLLISALINPAFNHEGITILCYLPSGNPLTGESVIYGISAAVMLVSVVEWFASFNEIMTSDKLMYLFGKIMPALSLVFSMTLRFVPKFKKQIKDFFTAQQVLSGNVDKLGIVKKAKMGIKIFSAVVTMSMEEAIETAQSMKYRGYGLSKRSAFSNYRFFKRDILILIWIVSAALYIFIGYMNGTMYFVYFPTIKYIIPSQYEISVFIVYFMLCITPVFIELKEALNWKILKLKI